MSYKLDVSFKNCEKLDVIDKINEFVKLVKDNALDIIKENVRYNLYSLRSFYEETKDVRRLKDEIDKILDKIRRSGYQSLTEEEKRKLFDRK